MNPNEIFITGARVDGNSIGAWAYKKERAKLIRDLDSNRFFRVSYAGMNRIGKSSLLEYAFQHLEKKYEEDNNNISVFLSLDSIEAGKPDSFWKCLIESIKEACGGDPAASWAQKHIWDPAWDNVVRWDSNDRSQLLRSIQRLFEKCFFRAGLGIHLFLDEFDNAINIWNVIDIQVLRDLISSNGYGGGLSLLIAHRQPLTAIEDALGCDGSRSTLSGVMTGNIRFLKGCSDEDLDTYWQYLEQSLNTQISIQQKQSVLYYCGHCPYLLNLFALSLVQFYEEEQIPSEEDFHSFYTDNLNLIIQINAVYKRILSVLEESNQLTAYIGCTVGPASLLENGILEGSVVQNLEASGYIIKQADDNYSTFSGYMEQILREYEIDNKWKNIVLDVEQRMRKIIVTLEYKLSEAAQEQGFTTRTIGKGRYAEEKLWTIVHRNKETNHPTQFTEKEILEAQRRLKQGCNFSSRVLNAIESLTFNDLVLVLTEHTINWPIICNYYHMEFTREQTDAWTKRLEFLTTARNWRAHYDGAPSQDNVLLISTYGQEFLMIFNDGPNIE